jgi:hypothetical protein
MDIFQQPPRSQSLDSLVDKIQGILANMEQKAKERRGLLKNS